MNERETQCGVELADPDSLLGMLQRGRGKGYLAALETPAQEVWPLLFECIMNDPRVDRQCEPREEYYASLILKTGMDLEPLRAHVKQDDGPYESYGGAADLALETLASLAGKGSREALAILRDYVLYGYGWEWATVALSDTAAPGALEGIGKMLYQRISGDSQLHSQFRTTLEEHWGWYCQDDEDNRDKCRYLLPVCEPWKGLCRESGGFADLFARVGLPYDHPPASQRVTDTDVAALSVEDLLSSVSKASFYPSRRAFLQKVSVDDEDRLLQCLSSDNKRCVMLAFCGLGKLGTPRAFEAVKSYIESSENADSGVRGEALGAIWQMPGSLTLETARRWFLREEWYLQSAAGGILEHHATLEDVPLLMQVLRTPEVIQREDYRLSFILTTLTRFNGFGRIPELEQIFCQAGDCYLRGDAAEAMAATAPEHFTAEYAFECLWDCDWSAFKTGCAMVDLSTPGAIERLQELAADPYESDETGQVARKRLETAS